MVKLLNEGRKRKLLEGPVIWTHLYSVLHRHPYLVIRAARVLVSNGLGLQSFSDEVCAPLYLAIAPVLRKVGMRNKVETDWAKLREIACRDLRKTQAEDQTTRLNVTEGPP